MLGLHLRSCRCRRLLAASNAFCPKLAPSLHLCSALSSQPYKQHVFKPQSHYSDHHARRGHRSVHTPAATPTTAWRKQHTAWAVADEAVVRIRAHDVSKTNIMQWFQGIATGNMTAHQAEKPPHMIYSAFLNHKGRVLFDAFLVHAAADEHFLVVSQCKLQLALQHLQRLDVRKKFSISVVDQQCCAVLLSQNIDFDVNVRSTATTASEIVADQARLYTLKDPRHERMGHRTLIFCASPSQLQHFKTAHSSTQVSVIAFDWLRIRCGLPACAWITAQGLAVDQGAELTSERSMPLESGLEEAGALEFEKGCYLGQEIVARQKHQGVVRKRLYLIRLWRCQTTEEQSQLPFDNEISSMKQLNASEPMTFMDRLLDESFDADAESSGPIAVSITSAAPSDPSNESSSSSTAIGQLHSIHFNFALAQLRTEIAENNSMRLTCSIGAHRFHLQVFDPAI